MSNIDTTNNEDISLQPLQAEVMALFNQNPYNRISTYDFRKSGIGSPAQCIANLKSKGAIIEKELKSATDESGRVHKNVAWYIFKGWC